MMRIGPVIGGSAVIAAGISMYKTGWINRYILPIHPVMAIIIIIFGVIIVIVGLKSSKGLGDGYFICRECKRRYKASHVRIMQCSICNGKLIKEQPDSKKL